MAQSLADKARAATYRKENAERLRKEKAENDAARKEKARIESGGRRLKPLIEKVVKKSLSAGFWRIPLDKEYDEAYMYAACRQLDLHFRGLEHWADGLEMCVSIEPEEHHYAIGNTD